MLKKLLCLAALVFIQGCSVLIDSKLVAVDSFSPTSTSGDLYYLSGTTNTYGLNLQLFENDIQQILEEKGYTRTFTELSAKYHISYDYSLTGPYGYAESYVAPINPWWSNQTGYAGIRNGMFDTPWYGYSNIPFSTYFVKKLYLNAKNKTGTLLWETVSYLNTDNDNPNEDYEYLIFAMTNFIDITSNKINYLNISENPKNKSFSVIY